LPDVSRGQSPGPWRRHVGISVFRLTASR
jgi:hypothetical protein